MPLCEGLLHSQVMASSVLSTALTHREDDCERKFVTFLKTSSGVAGLAPTRVGRYDEVETCSE
jgi:hypothetical protein